ncbi:MAG: hypothetical protein ACYSWQ_05140 [Planctomycetota bacterium]|jgi:hypothetical protein
MKHLKSIFKIRDKKIGLIFVREQGLDLEVWDGPSRPCWSMGVVHTEDDSRGSTEAIGIPQVGRWLLVLPTYLCTTRYTKLPSSRPEEIAAMLEFEVPQLLPCSTQLWTWDFCVASWGQDGTSQVLVALSPLSVVESAMEQVQALGIEPYLATVSAALHGTRPPRGKDGAETTLCGRVWWDHDSLDFSAMNGPRLVFLRGARVCGQNSQALGWAEAEVGRSLSMLRERGICDGELSLRVGGTNPDVPRLVEKLGQSVSTDADLRGDLATYDAALAMVRETAGTTVGSWRSTRGHVSCINLLPRHRREKDRRARRRREILGIGLRACFIALLTLLCLRMSIWRKTRLLGQYQQRIAQIAPLARQLQFLQDQLNMIQTQVQGSVSMLDIIGQMYEVLPEDVTIHYLSIDQKRQVVVRAQARWLSQAFDCIGPLEQSAYLSNVRQSYAHLRELEGQVLIDFELRADLEVHPRTEAGP